MTSDALRAFAARYGGPVKLGEPLARHSTFRVGGPADAFVVVRVADELRRAVQAARACGLRTLVLGGESNVLPADAGLSGVVIANRAQAWWVVTEPAGDRPAVVRAESGVRLGRLAREAAKRGLGGLAWAEGIPGTVGGGVVSNAGAFGGCIADVLLAAELLWPDGALCTLPACELDLRYRHSRLHDVPDAVVLSADLALRPGAPDELLARIRQIGAERKAKQPAGASAGSVFKNPPGAAAGALIDRAGLKGTRVGGAWIALEHGNFILTNGRARAADVWALITLAREAVAQQFGIALELEVQLVGEWQREAGNG
ncbi:MAG: UDP-N-acetylmuramate dehydrogenase [Chloroflexi bacterium]|nr:UDP-N-acetylmuramate dehydrogenase [Chloroflexota bacterium]